MNALSQPEIERSPTNSACPQISIVGYGNDLRGDDGVGPQVATIFAGRRLPGVRSLPLHQLTPELAQMLATVELAIFVDAYSVDVGSTSVLPDIQVHSLAPLQSGLASSHTSDPRVLLMLAQVLYGHAPQAWLVGVPAVNFSLGINLSPIAQRGVALALDAIERLLENWQQDRLFGDRYNLPRSDRTDNFVSPNLALF
jgi:hydrogenase maturation protease